MSYRIKIVNLHENKCRIKRAAVDTIDSLFHLFMANNTIVN